MADNDGLMTVDELAAYLRKPVNTIYQWNRRGDGPRYMKVGRAALYRRSDVDQWLEAKYVPRGEVA